MKENKKIGLALSGGGFRATAFHLGTLKKLKELNLLDKVDVISSISGGSIINAYYGLEGSDFNKFEEKLTKKLEHGVLGFGLWKDWKLILFVLVHVVFFVVWLLSASWILNLLFVSWIVVLLRCHLVKFPIGRVVYNAFDRIFFDGKKLKDLPEKPLIAINATNIESGRLMTFSRKKMGDSYYEYGHSFEKPILFRPDDFPVSKAVYASCCLPHVFSPLRIEPKYFINPTDAKIVTPTLIDGGIYDNQGIHKLTQKGSSYQCDYIIVSDAGNGVLKAKAKWNNQIWLVSQMIEVFFTRIKNLQMQRNVYSDGFAGKRVAYMSLTWKIQYSVEGFVANMQKGKIDPAVMQRHGISLDDIKNKSSKELVELVKKSINYTELIEKDTNEEEYLIAKNVSTLQLFLSTKQIHALMKRAEVLTELQIKLHCPDLLD